MSCIACHRTRGLPQVKPLPGVETCVTRSDCFVNCFMRMIAGKSNNGNSTCPTALLSPENSTVLDDYTVPPTVKLAYGTVFPFCLARSSLLTSSLDNNTEINATFDATNLLACTYSLYTHALSNTTWNSKSCYTHQERC